MLIGWRKVVSKLFIIPQRYVLGIMCLLAIGNAYTMRVCLNLAITKMVTVKSSHEITDPDACIVDVEDTVASNSSSTTVVATNVQMFEWDEATQGLLLSAFYYGYVITHIPGGMIAERWGGKWTLGIGLLATAIGTLLTPIVVNWGGATGLFILRVVEGLGEGPTMPAMMAVLSKWTPPAERGIMGSMVFGGAQIGNIAGSLISGVLLSDGNWHSVFYFFGCVGIIWFLLWIALCYSTPAEHPFIKEKERIFLEGTVSGLAKKEIGPTPWKAILTSVPIWALIIAAIGHDWGYFTMVTDLPKYMTDVLKFDIKSTGFLSSLPYLAMWISAFIFGFIGDFTIKKSWLSIKNSRIVFTTIAATGPAICIVLASYAGCSRDLAMVYFVLAMTLMGAYYCGMKVNPLDLAPNYAGSVTAVVNGIAAVSGIISPYLVGLLTPDQTMVQWRLAFWICLAILVITNIIYIIWADGKQQWWDDVEKHGYPTGWKHGPLPGHSKDFEASKCEKSEKTDTPSETKDLK